MKLTGVELRPENSSTVVALSFRDPTRGNPYNVTGIDGLSADVIVPKYYASSGGSKFYSLSLQQRQIVVKVSLNPRWGLNETYSDLRDSLYKIISSSRTGRLQIRFMNSSNTVAAVSGFVAKFEAPQFEKTQEVLITIDCDNAMLKALNPTIVDVSTLNPSNVIVTDSQSTAPHGFAFSVLIVNATPSLKVIDPSDSSWAFEVAPPGGFLHDDIISFSSETDDKFILLLRAGLYYYLADNIIIGSIWPIMFPGTNHFLFTNLGDLTISSFQYYASYWGV